MATAYIKKENLQTGQLYVCKARNFTIGRWNGKNFSYVGREFGQLVMDTEQHYDDDPHHGTVQPIMTLSQAEATLFNVAEPVPLVEPTHEHCLDCDYEILLHRDGKKHCGVCQDEHCKFNAEMFQ